MLLVGYLLSPPSPLQSVTGRWGFDVTCISLIKEQYLVEWIIRDRYQMVHGTTVVAVLSQTIYVLSLTFDLLLPCRSSVLSFHAGPPVCGCPPSTFVSCPPHCSCSEHLWLTLQLSISSDRGT